MAYRIIGDYASLKSITVSDIDKWLEQQANKTSDSDITFSEAFSSVPWLYRGITLRADAVSSLPYQILNGQDDITDHPDYKSLTAKLKQLLWLAEASKTAFGAAYWFKQSNRIRANVTPRWMATSTITPATDSAKGLIGFTRTLGATSTTYPVEKFVYFWQPSLEEEVAPGIAPATVALAAAGVLRNADRMVEGYFKRGAIKVTILGVPAGTHQDEIDRLEKWWTKLATGIQNAMTAIGLRADVKPQVIGSDLKDTSAPELTDKKREDIATALSIPQSLLWQASAYATARHEERLAFYEQFVIPECESIAEVLNEQLFGLEDLIFKFMPEKLPIMQDAQLQKAQALQQLVGAGIQIMTVDEARNLMGRKPMAQVTEEETPEPQPGEVEAATEKLQEETRVGAAKALRQWRDKACKRLKDGKSAAVEFESDAIPHTLQAAIAGALIEAHTAEAVKGVFADAARWGTYP